MAGSARFTWVDRVQVPYFDERTQSSYQALRLRFTWLATGQVLTVYVPATATPDQINTAIVAAGAKDEALEALGAPPAAG